MEVIIAGGGVIGACCAYFLSRRGARVTVFERADVACAASGKSGGFLALDWCDGGPLERMARRSYALHRELADSNLGDWGYRTIETLAVHAAEGHHLRSRMEHPAWLADEACAAGVMGTPETTAQIDPCTFTRTIMRAAEQQGAIVRIAEIEHISDGQVWAAGHSHRADRVVIALGPWSMRARDWIRLPPVYGLKGQSVVYRPSPIETAHNFFLDYITEDAQRLSPEIVPRPDGTLYACGLSYEDPIPDDPLSIEPDAALQARLQSMTEAVLPALKGARPVATQACYRPVTEDGLPLLGVHPEHERIVIATGHSVWGMLNGPATGEAVAELIMDGKTTTLRIDRFNPSRLMQTA